MTEEHVIQNDPDFEAEARRMMQAYEAGRKRRGDDPGSSAGVSAPLIPTPPNWEAGNARALPERIEPEV